MKKTVTKAQITKIHVMISQLGLSLDDKKELIYNHTEGRTQSSKELYFEEAKFIISHLCRFDPKERLKGSITSLAYKAGIIYGDTAEDKKINMAKLNLFIRSKGTVKKDLNHLSYEELLKVQSQFQAIARNIGKSKDKKAADTAVNDLLKELDLTTI